MTSRLEQIDAYLDGTLSEIGCADLEAALIADSAVRLLFVDRSRLNGRLRNQYALDRSASAKKSKPTVATAPGAPLSAAGVPMYRKGYEPQPFKLRVHHIALAGVAAALLVACGLGVYLLTTSVDPQPDPVDPNQPGPSVATLIENTGDLRTPHGFTAEGDSYGRGEYTLASGTAEFMLTNAVNVKLRGDTRMHMRNDMNVALTRGSAEFVCPTDAKGFTVHLPDNSKIVDLGTAFEVEIDEDGQPQLRVTEGEVEWTGAGPNAAPVLIAAGQRAHMLQGQITVKALPLIITPTSATANQNGAPDSNFIEHIDGSGLSGVGDILDQTHATATGGNWAYFSGGPDFTGDTATYALPAASTVNQVHVWPFWLATNINWQIVSLDIEFSTDGGVTFPTTISGVTLDDIQATGPAGAIEVQTRDFATQTGVTHIRFSNIGNNGGANAGLMEVRFGFQRGAGDAAQFDQPAPIDLKNVHQPDTDPSQTQHRQRAGDKSRKE